MSKFACLIHPLDLALFSTFEPAIKEKRKELVKKVFEWSRPLTVSEVTGLRSLTGKESKGILVLYNVLPEQILSMRSSVLLKRVIEAGKIAQDWGADIFGLAAYTAQIGKKGILVAKNLEIPITTGTSYTIVVVIQSILKAAKELAMDLHEINLAIIGATGAIGRISSQILSRYIPNIILVGRHKQKLEIEAASLKTNGNKMNVRITDNIKDAISNADIVMTATNSPYTLIDIKDVQSGSLICDVSLPKNVTHESAVTRDDVLVIDGGIVKPPGDVKFNFYYGLPEGLCYACMAETMILALEEAFEYYSIGGDINLYKVKEIERMAIKHGFKLAEFRGFNKKITEEQINKVRDCFLMRNKMRSKIKL